MTPAGTDSLDCYICEQPGADTRDHVIPKNLFAERPSNLITLPAHQSCNTNLSKDEEFLRAFVLSSAYEHHEAKQCSDASSSSVGAASDVSAHPETLSAKPD